MSTGSWRRSLSWGGVRRRWNSVSPLIRSSLSLSLLAALLMHLSVDLTALGPPAHAGEGVGQEASLTEVLELTASDGQAGDFFGCCLVIDGDTAVVLAGHDHPGAPGFGAAYVFERNQGGPGAWGEVVEVNPSDAVDGDQWGVGMAVFGDTLVVGARFDDDAGVNSGSAFVYERDAGGADQWGEVAILRAADTAADDEFGAKVALSDTTLVVTAIGDNDNGDDSGSAYVFEREELDPHVWLETAKLTPFDGHHHDAFGWSASMSGDTLVVGTIHVDGTTGAAYVFERNAPGPGEWGQVAKLQPSELSPGDFFGIVAIDGDIIAVGSNLYDGPAQDSGSVWIFRRDAGGPGRWGEVAQLTASDAASGDELFLPAVDGDWIVIGAPGVASDTGAIYLFRRDPSGSDVWEEMTKATASNGASGDWFGAVSMDGDTVLAGAVLADSPEIDSGSAYVFQVLRDDSLTISGSCPGEVTIGGAASAPFNDLMLFAGPDEGTSFVANGPCGGTELDIEFNRFLLRLETDESGHAGIRRSTSEPWCGRYLQAVERPSCSTTNVVQIPQ